MKWLIVGLGNPGKEYVNTRHNVGFMVVDTFKKQDTRNKIQEKKQFNALVAKIGEIIVMKPQTFMNESGKAVAAAVRFYKIPPDHIIVIHDDLDIVQGSVKAGMEKGPKVHNGLNSIEKSLGTNHFWRVRVGVDGRTVAERTLWSGEKYVLLPLSASDKKVIDEEVLVAVEKMTMIIEGRC